MNTVLKYDEYILTKELNDKVKKVGAAFEIAKVMDDAFLLRESKSKVAVGVISFEDFEKHFVKEDDFKGWSKWTSLIGFDGQNDCLYKTNRKKVIVKFIKDNIKAESCCHRDDEFNLAFGIQVAYLRCLNKALAKQKAEYEEKLKVINRNIADNNDIVKSMVESLEG